MEQGVPLPIDVIYGCIAGPILNSVLSNWSFQKNNSDRKEKKKRIALFLNSDRLVVALILPKIGRVEKWIGNRRQYSLKNKKKKRTQMVKLFLLLYILAYVFYFKGMLVGNDLFDFQIGNLTFEEIIKWMRNALKQTNMKYGYGS